MRELAEAIRIRRAAIRRQRTVPRCYDEVMTKNDRGRGARVAAAAAADAEVIMTTTNDGEDVGREPGVVVAAKQQV